MKTRRNTVCLPLIAAAYMYMPSGFSEITLIVDTAVTEWSSSTPGFPSPVNQFPVGGSGQVNGGFTATNGGAQGSNNGGQVAMRAANRFTGTITPVALPGLGFYQTVVGESTAGLGVWNYDLHIDLRGSGTLLADWVSLLTIQNLNTMDSVTYNVREILRDGLVTGAGLDVPTATAVAGGAVLLQSSQNPGFAGFGVPYDPNLPSTYRFTLALTPVPLGAADGYDTLVNVIDVNVVPEPNSFMLLALGVTGLLRLVRRR